MLEHLTECDIAHANAFMILNYQFYCCSNMFIDNRDHSEKCHQICTILRTFDLTDGKAIYRTFGLHYSISYKLELSV